MCEPQPSWVLQTHPLQAQMVQSPTGLTATMGWIQKAPKHGGTVEIQPHPVTFCHIQSMLSSCITSHSTAFHFIPPRFAITLLTVFRDKHRAIKMILEKCFPTVCTEFETASSSAVLHPAGLATNWSKALQPHFVSWVVYFVLIFPRVVFFFSPPLLPTTATLLIKGKVHRINFSALIIEGYNPNLFNELIISHGGILIMKYF